MTKQISSNNNPVVARPFLKWVGGKSQLLEQLEEFFPQKFNNYLEPMVGGGAVFFYLRSTNRLKKRTFLLDVNKELINCYKIIKKNLNLLTEKLKELKRGYDKDAKGAFYSVRRWDRKKDFKKRMDIERAARTIFLNKTCYNGLYRVNGKGQFNTPIGSYNDPNICDEENLYAVKKALKKTSLLAWDFEKILDIVSAGDFVYFDPPYNPLNHTANFTSYTSNNFDKEDQKRLKDVFEKLTKIGCKVMLSNSDTNFIHH